MNAQWLVSSKSVNKVPFEATSSFFLHPFKLPPGSASFAFDCLLLGVLLFITEAFTKDKTPNIPRQ